MRTNSSVQLGGGCPTVRNLLVFICTFIMFFCGYFFRFSIAPIVDVLQTDLNTTASGVGLLGSFIQLFFFVPQIPIGILLQFIQPKFILPIASILFAITSYLFARSETFMYAIIMASVNGLASAPLWLSFLRIIDDTFTRKQVTFAIGMQMLLTYGGLYTANYMQALIYDTFNDWRSIFYVLSGASIASASLFVLLTFCDCDTPIRPITYKRSLRTPPEHDTGTITMTQTQTQSINRSNSPRSNNKNSPRPNNNLTNQKVSDHSDAQTSLLSDSGRTGKSTDFKERLGLICDAFGRACCLRLNWILSIWGFAGLVLVMAFNGFWFINYAMIKFNYSRQTATLLVGSFYLIREVSAPFIGRLAMKYSKRQIFMIMGSCLTLCSCVIIYVAHDGTPILFVAMLNLISGIGTGNYGIMWTLQREYNAYWNCRDTAAGLVNTIINSAGFVGQLVIGKMIDIHWNMRDGDKNEKGDRIYIVSDFEYALIIIPITIGVAIISSFCLKETHGENLNYTKKSDNDQYLSQSSSTASTTMRTNSSFLV